MAYSFKDVYGIFFYYPSTPAVSHRAGASAGYYWHGKLFGGDANKVQLGAGGNSIYGSNFLDNVYRLIGFKFSSMA